MFFFKIKSNQMKSNEIKWNQMKSNEIKSNENQMKSNPLKPMIYFIFFIDKNINWKLFYLFYIYQFQPDDINNTTTSSIWPHNQSWHPHPLHTRLLLSTFPESTAIKCTSHMWSAFWSANTLQLFRVSILWNLSTRMQTSVLQLSTFSSGFLASFQSTFVKGFSHSAKRASCIQTLLIGLFFLTRKNKMSKRKKFALKQLSKPTARRQHRFHPTHSDVRRLHLHLHPHQQKNIRIAFAAAVAGKLIVLLKSFTTRLQIQFGKPRQRHPPPNQTGTTWAGTTWKKTFASTTTTPAAPSSLINEYKRLKRNKQK